jgi:hypothetical protein
MHRVHDFGNTASRERALNGSHCRPAKSDPESAAMCDTSTHILFTSPVAASVALANTFESRHHIASTSSLVRCLEQSYQHTYPSSHQEVGLVRDIKSTMIVSSIPNRRLNDVLENSKSTNPCKRPSTAVCRYKPRPVSTRVNNNVGRSREAVVRLQPCAADPGLLASFLHRKKVWNGKDRQKQAA